MGGKSKADATPLLLFLNFVVLFVILCFSLNLDKGAWLRKILKPEFHFHNSEVVHNAAQKETTMTSFSCFSCRFVYNGVGVAYIRCTCFRSTL